VRQLACLLLKAYTQHCRQVYTEGLCATIYSTRQRPLVGASSEGDNVLYASAIETREAAVFAVV